jgi:serine/threonine-protein kinase RsbW
MKNHTQAMVLSIPSDFKYLGAVDAAIQDLAREFAFSENSINDVSTALIEACTNAIEHGNKFAKNKRVKVVLSFNGNSFTGCVYDEGDGFDYEAVLARTKAPDPTSERGRGLIIMKAFTDKLRFCYEEKEGLCVELTKTSEDPVEERGDVTE